MASASCEICQTDTFKYRCSKCRTRSCSLQCFKKHQNDCEADRQRTQDGKEDPLQVDVTSDPISQSLISRPDRREDLSQMFSKYPWLKAKLRSIYEATQDPGSRSENKAHGGSHFERRWSEEKGFNHGMDLLQRQLGSEGADSEDLRIFAAYVAADTG